MPIPETAPVWSSAVIKCRQQSRSAPTITAGLKACTTTKGLEAIVAFFFVRPWCRGAFFVVTAGLKAEGTADWGRRTAVRCGLGDLCVDRRDRLRASSCLPAFVVAFSVLTPAAATCR